MQIVIAMQMSNHSLNQRLALRSHCVYSK